MLSILRQRILPAIRQFTTSQKQGKDVSGSELFSLFITAQKAWR
jgi:hypothetical protein